MNCIEYVDHFGEFCGLHVSSRKICSPVPVCVPLFGNRISADVIKLRQGLTGLGRALPMTVVLEDRDLGEEAM